MKKFILLIIVLLGCMASCAPRPDIIAADIEETATEFVEYADTSSNASVDECTIINDANIQEDEVLIVTTVTEKYDTLGRLQERTAQYVEKRKSKTESNVNVVTGKSEDVKNNSTKIKKETNANKTEVVKSEKKEKQPLSIMLLKVFFSLLIYALLLHLLFNMRARARVINFVKQKILRL